MNRKSKVIVSIVGITIVLLALLGITYAYYLTRIEGNTNTNSISITTADLKLVYSENSPEIITENNIMPGTTIGEKTFTVSNTGNSAVEDYKVVLEYAVIENVVPSVFVRPQDFEITMTCVSKNIETNEVSGTCSGYTGTWNNESFEMTTNDIAENIKHEYTLTIFYANPDIDQSDDMGKNLNLKVQIYGANETSTITGTINNVDETYAIKLNSNPKISTIKNVGTKENPKYQYKFIGVEHNIGDDSHTLTLVDKNNYTQSTGNITIKKGTNATVDGSTITVKDNQTNIYLTTSSGSSTLTNSATFNPYLNNINLLTYHIINNSINNKNGTEYSDKPLTSPAEQISGVTNYKIQGEESTYINTMSSVSNYASKTWYYYDTYEVDTITGKFTLSGKQSCTYSSCYNNLVGKYLYTTSASSNTNASNHIAATNTNLSNVYKVVEATSSSLKYVKVFNSPNEAERVLVPTIDDYGTGYYYRGDVKDNYVNFAGMCWKVVRIQGDGSIKLILEDKYTTCDDTEDIDGIGTTDYKYTGNWSGTELYIFGYDTNTYRVDFLNYNGGLADSFSSFQNNQLNANDLQKLKVNDWCYDDKITEYKHYDSYWNLMSNSINAVYTNEYYAAYTRLYTNKKPSLKCSGTKLKKYKEGIDMYVATLTADEIVFAGGIVSEHYIESNCNYNYYLMNNYSKYGSKGVDFWLLSPWSYIDDGGYGYSSYISKYGYLSNMTAYGDYELYHYSSRPAVVLKNNVEISIGDGTISNPYVIG